MKKMSTGVPTLKQVMGSRKRSKGLPTLATLKRDIPKGGLLASSLRKSYGRVPGLAK